MGPSVRCATLDGYVGLARSCGLEPARLLREAGLDVADLAVPDSWIPAAAVARLLERSARRSGREDFGLRLAGLRRLATPEPLSVCFSHGAPASPATHHALLGPRLQFGHGFTGLVLYAGDLDAANTAVDPLLRPYARQFLEVLGSPRAPTATGQVRELVEMLLPLGRCSTAQVAR